MALPVTDFSKGFLNDVKFQRLQDLGRAWSVARNRIILSLEDFATWILSSQKIMLPPSPMSTSQNIKPCSCEASCPQHGDTRPRRDSGGRCLVEQCQQGRRQGLLSVGTAVTVPVGLSGAGWAVWGRRLLPTRGDQAAPGVSAPQGRPSCRSYSQMSQSQGCEVPPLCPRCQGQCP